MNLMIVSGMFVCSSFLISVCMFIKFYWKMAMFVQIKHLGHGKISAPESAPESAPKSAPESAPAPPPVYIVGL